MLEPQETAQPSRRGRWALAITLILGGIAGLAAWSVATPGAVSYYATPSEIQVQGDRAMDRVLRLGGRVATGSLERSGSSVSFAVSDGTNQIPVVYQGDVPDTLKDQTDVIAEGRLGADGTLHAERVLAKCSSKFVPADSPEHLGEA